MCIQSGKSTLLCLLASLIILAVGALMDGCTPPPTEEHAAREEATPAATPRDAEAPIAEPEEPAGSIIKIKTRQGPILVELFDKDAPITAGNFLLLAEDGYYDGVRFHRVEPSFVVQGGDPTGTGSGGPGFAIPDELNPQLKHDRGILSMAHAGPNTGGSQFFICLGREATQHLDMKHSVFGRVIEGVEVVDKIRRNDPMLEVTVERESPDAAAAKEAARQARVP